MTKIKPLRAPEDHEASEKKLREAIFGLTRLYYERFHASSDFVPGETRIPYSARVYDEREMVSPVDSALEFWLTAGRYARKF
jgi:CDP-6-deoxy-D-xylo-4-hexulose-3-dehydrase